VTILFLIVYGEKKAQGFYGEDSIFPSGCIGILRRFGAKYYNYHTILLLSLAVLLLIALVYCFVWILIVIMQSLWGFWLSCFSYVFVLGNERYNERGFL
jgi:hypothetical protein